MYVLLGCTAILCALFLLAITPQRYDLKDSGATVTLDKQAKTVVVSAPADFVAGQVVGQGVIYLFDISADAGGNLLAPADFLFLSVRVGTESICHFDRF